MSKLLSILLLNCISLVVLSQDTITNQLKVLADSSQFDKIIKQFTSNPKDYSAKALYFIGLAYYMKEEDNNSIKYMDLSVYKDSTDPNPYYIKACTLNYGKKYAEAITCFQSAIRLNPNSPQFYSGLGDSYYYLEEGDKAIEAYKKATAQKKPLDRSYLMIAQIYADQKKNEESLAAYYIAKSKIFPKTESYKNVLYNIGLFELMREHYEKAEDSFLELIQLSPEDFRAYTKLIQVYYGRKQYEKAIPYRVLLYRAHKNGNLEEPFKDMFCFDQFKWNDKLIQAYERFQENGTKIYLKHLFYVVNKDNEVDFRIQTEYSPVSIELGGTKYLLCMIKGDTHSTFNIGFNDDFRYEDLKKSVIGILENKIVPTASSKSVK